MQSCMIICPTYDGKLQWDTAQALFALGAWARENKVDLCTLGVKYCSLVTTARIRAAEKFLNSKYDKLFFLDNDIMATMEDFVKLLHLSEKYDIATAMYCVKRDKDINFPISTHIPFRYNEEDNMIYIRGAGMGFTVINRRVFEAMEPHCKKFQDKDTGDILTDYFPVGVKGDRYVGEDISFFEFADELGFSHILDHNINLKHVGLKEYDHKITDFLVNKGILERYEVDEQPEQKPENR